MTIDDDGYYSSGIHPPDVVLVSSSNATSPTQEVILADGLGTSAYLDHRTNDDTICSPLSTAPNSPHRGVSYEEDEEDDDDTDDEEEEVVIRPEEVQELLNTPVSGKYSTNYNKLQYNNRAPHEVPFDESHHTNPPPRLPKATTTKTTANSETIDPLLGNPRLYQQQASQAKSASPAVAAVVTPSSGTRGGLVSESPIVVPVVEEDIDPYVEEDDDDMIHHISNINHNNSRPPPLDTSLDDRDEKKVDVDTSPPRSRSPPHYAGFLSTYNNGSANKILSQHQHRFSSSQSEDPLTHPRVVPLAMSEDDMPHDERLDSSGEMEEFMEPGDFIESTRSGGPEETDSLQGNDEDDEDGSNTPIKKALETAEREVQEMERRVQLMIQQRRQSSSRSQQRFSDEHDNTTQTKMQEDPSDRYVMEEPPSLSPRTGAAAAASRNKDVNSSVDSGCSSFYYDGSVMGSTASNNSSREEEDAINMTLNSNTSSSALAAPTTTTSNSQATSMMQQQDFYARLESSGSALDSSREERSSNMALSSSGSGFVASTTFEEFTSRFDHEATNGTFARAIDETSRAFNQVTEDVANFLNGPSFKRDTKQQQAFQQRQLPPISPSHDSDCTPQFGNLSPRPTMNGRRPLNATAGATTYQRGTQGTNADADLLYSQRPSAKLAKARSLVSERQSKLSPTTAGYEDGGTKDRARQVMNKREHQQQQQSNRDGASQRSNGNNAAVVAISSSKSDVSTSSSLPVPPTLTRIAAIMESLGGGSSAYAGGNQNETAQNNHTENATDWQGSVSQLMEEYQAAITESLRNLSMEEVAGLARQHENTGHQHEFGKDTMIAPGIPLSSGPKFLAFDDQRNEATRNSGNQEKLFSDSHDEYDDMVAEMTFGACLQMPDLDHPPLMTTRNSSTAQQGNKDYQRGVAGVLQYDHCSVTELLYHDEQDDHFRHFGDDPEHQERAVFAKQLSERLLSLGATSSADTSASVECRDSPEKLRSMRDDNNLSFDSKESSMAMSPPKRSKDAIGKNLDGACGGTGLFVCNLPQAKCIPSSEQPSVCSDGFSLEHSNANSRFVSPNRDTGATKSGGNAGSSVIKPTMVESIDNETGIAKGDVMLSLLCDNSFQASKEKPDSWAWRIREAIWRCRDMRSDFSGPMGSKNGLNDDGDMREIRRAPSLPVDVDDVRVVGGIHNVASIQEKALAHLRQNEFEQALELYEDIIFNYYSFFEQVLAKREEFSSEDVTMELSNFKPYIGASLHNLGVIHLLKGDYDDAFSFFKRAVDNRRACLGETHSDCITSLVRLATCRFAMDNFADAHTNLELALALAGSKARTTSDYCQLGEILNNLGCLSYMCGQPTKAMKLFRESLDVQLAVLNSTLYGGSKYSAHSATLSISVTRGNIGFLALVLKDVSSGILALESALREQRLLLNGAHVTLVSTMDHLAVANLLQGRTQKAVKMLRRIYDLQKAAHGPNDPRCFATRQKIMTIRGQQVRASSTDPVDHPTSGPAQKQEQPPAVRPRPERQQSAHSQQQQQQVGSRPKHAGRQTSEGESSSRCTPSVGGGGSSNNSHSHNKVGLFKAIRSLGRKKTT